MFSSVWFQPKQFLKWEAKCITYTSCSKVLVLFPLHSPLSLLEAVIFIHPHVLLCLAQCLAHFHSAILYTLPLLSLFALFAKSIQASVQKSPTLWSIFESEYFPLPSGLPVCFVCAWMVIFVTIVFAQVFFAPQRGQSAIRRWIDLHGESACLLTPGALWVSY